MKKKIKQDCMVFLLCKNKASTTIDHPMLGEVPACKQCSEWYKKMSKPREE